MFKSLNSSHRGVLFAALLLLPGGILPPSPAEAQQGGAADLDRILGRADKLFDEARTLYEGARAGASVKGFVEAGFKLEEARIKYLVLQEIGDAEKQKAAADRLRTVNQLSKLIHDGKVAIAGTPADAPAKPPDPGPKDAAPATPPPEPAPERPAPPTVPPPTASARVPVPDAEKERQAVKLVRDIFKDQYDKKVPAERQALARALLAQARETRQDPLALWAYCREAEDVAIQAGDAPSALEAIDVMMRAFDVDPLAMRTEALGGLSKTVKTPAECSTLVTAIFTLLEDLIAADQYDAAERASALATQTARRSGESALLARATSRAADLADAKARFRAMKSILETLAKTPEDGPANAAMGQFLCFVKGSWDLGLRFLAKGSDPSLQSLASRETALPTEPSELAAIAEGWADLGSKEKNALRKSQLLTHARLLYEAALPSATGFLRIKIEKRISDLGGAAGAPAGLNLLPLIDVKLDVGLGTWKFEGKTLVSPADKRARIQIPYIPPEEYDLTLEIVRTQKEGAAVIGLAAGGQQFILICDGWEGDTAGLDQLDNKSAIANETCVHRRLFDAGKPTSVVCSIRKDGVSVTVGGVKIVTWKGGFNRLSLWGDWRMNRNDTLFLATDNGVFKFSKVAIVEPSDKGRRVR